MALRPKEAMPRRSYLHAGGLSAAVRAAQAVDELVEPGGVGQAVLTCRGADRQDSRASAAAGEAKPPGAAVSVSSSGLVLCGFGD